MTLVIKPYFVLYDRNILEHRGPIGVDSPYSAKLAEVLYVSGQFYPDITIAKRTFAPILALAMASILAVQPASAQNQSPTSDGDLPQPQSVLDIVSCQEVTDDTERLQCYDRTVAQFSDATKKGDVIVAEKEVVEEARKELFGLSLSDNPIFGDKDDPGVKSLEATIASVTRQRSGKWIIILDNGAKWRKTDTKVLRRSPKPGQSVVIERAPFGSFNARIEGQKPIKVLRVN